MTKNDKEVKQAASNMIERYGDNALGEADLRILELQARKQPEALRLWLAIRSRVEFLLLKQPDA